MLSSRKMRTLYLNFSSICTCTQSSFQVVRNRVHPTHNTGAQTQILPMVCKGAVQSDCAGTGTNEFI